MDPRYEVLDDATRIAHGFIDSLPARPVGAPAGLGLHRAHDARRQVAAT